MSRKILYSPDYGAGWVSWAYYGRETQIFILEYPPFVDFLDGGGKFVEGGGDWL